MFASYIRAYPWDLMDGELAAELDRLRGEIGVTGVSLWAAAPRVQYLRARPLVPRILGSSGGLLFQSDESRYQSTRCKPLSADWLKEKDPLNRLTAECSRRDLMLRAVVSAARAGRLAPRHPELACKNLFGTVCEQTVCLSSPDVRTFLVSLVRELLDRGISTVVVTDFEVALPLPTDRRALGGMESLGNWERAVLATCFCESCLQLAAGAGVDAASAKRSAADFLQRAIERGRPAARMAPEVETELLVWCAYRAATALQADALLALGDAADDRLVVEQPAPSESTLLAMAAPLVPKTGTMVTVWRPEDLSDAPPEPMQHAEARVPAECAIGPDANRLVALFRRAAEAGFAGIEIDHLGLLPEPAMTVVKQAVRYARRTATA